MKFTIGTQQRNARTTKWKKNCRWKWGNLGMITRPRFRNIHQFFTALCAINATQSFYLYVKRTRYNFSPFQLSLYIPINMLYLPHTTSNFFRNHYSPNHIARDIDVFIHIYDLLYSPLCHRYHYSTGML